MDYFSNTTTTFLASDAVVDFMLKELSSIIPLLVSRKVLSLAFPATLSVSGLVTNIIKAAYMLQCFVENDLSKNPFKLLK